MAENVKNGPEEFMGALFGIMAEKTTVRSHEPHKTLKGWANAWPEVERRGWVKVEPYNKHGSIAITATPDGIKVAHDQARQAALEVFGGSFKKEEGQ